jgi:hypothetical protein
MKYNLKELKKVICRECNLKGHCANHIKCSLIRNIESIFSKRISSNKTARIRIEQGTLCAPEVHSP